MQCLVSRDRPGYTGCLQAWLPRLHRDKTSSGGFFPPIASSIMFALCFQVDPYLPFEFTHEGMLERVSVLIQNQVKN